MTSVRRNSSQGLRVTIESYQALMVTYYGFILFLKNGFDWAGKGHSGE